MNRRVIRIRAVLGIGLAVALCGGCEQYPPPSADALYYYLANARVRGNLRVCWPGGQEYVARVMKLDTRLQTEVKPLEALLGIDALWPSDDPRWRDVKALAEAAAELSRELDAGAEQRAATLKELEKALAEFPDDLPLEGPEARTALLERVSDALCVDGEPLRERIAGLEGVAAARLRLVQEVRQCAAHFDTAASGLAFTEAECQQLVQARYAALEEAMGARHAVFWRYAGERVPEVVAALAGIDKKAQRAEYEHLLNVSAYLRNRLEATPKAYDPLIKAAEKKLQAHEKGNPKLTDEEAARLTRRLDDLKQRREAVEKQADTLLAVLKPRQGAPPDSRPAEGE